MKKTIIASLAILGCAAVVTTFALGGANLNRVFEVKATSRSFTFNAATGSQFDDIDHTQEVDQVVNVETGSSSPIRTVFTPEKLDSLAFGQGGRFVEAHPIANEEDASYSLTIGINNLTHFTMDLGVAKDGVGDGWEDTYWIALRDKGGVIRKRWYSPDEEDFKLDGDGNGTAHIEWDKEASGATYTVVEVVVELYFNYDSADANWYIESLSLAWNC